MHRNRFQLVVSRELGGNENMSSLHYDDDDGVDYCSRYRYNL